MIKTIFPCLLLFVTLSLRSQVVKNVTITSPGTLGSVLTDDEKNSVTSLVISGNIDASDFVVMRDQMPVLAEIDLSQVAINEYNGSGGPNPDLTNYPAHFIPSDAFYNPTIVTDNGKETLTRIVFPNTLQVIDIQAFANCYNLTEAEFPQSQSLSTIRVGAFFGCNNLINKVIPASVSVIDPMAFSNSSGDVTVANDNPNYSSVDGVLFDKNQTTLIHFPTNKVGSYVIPSTVTTIDRQAFSNCDQLAAVTLPENLRRIEDAAFWECYELSSITFPESVNYLGPMAFGYCYKLQHVEIPRHITVIEMGAFYACIDLISVNIPFGVTTIKSSAFYACNDLSSIVIPASVTIIETCAFSQNPKTESKIDSVVVESPVPIDLSNSADVFQDVDTINCALVVPQGSTAAYAKANQWKSFKKVIERIATDVNQPKSEEFKIVINPNPASDHILISGIVDDALVTIGDLQGQKVLEKKIGCNEKLDISDLHRGIYWLTVKTAKTSYSQKLVKK